MLWLGYWAKNIMLSEGMNCCKSSCNFIGNFRLYCEPLTLVLGCYLVSTILWQIGIFIPKISIFNVFHFISLFNHYSDNNHMTFFTSFYWCSLSPSHSYYLALFYSTYNPSHIQNLTFNAICSIWATENKLWIHDYCISEQSNILVINKYRGFKKLMLT